MYRIQWTTGRYNTTHVTGIGCPALASARRVVQLTTFRDGKSFVPLEFDTPAAAVAHIGGNNAGLCPHCAKLAAVAA